MFDNLSERLGSAVERIKGKGRLTDDNIKDALRQVRMALLEADVALPVVQELVGHIKEKALGQEFARNVAPGQAFVKIVYDELVHVMGDKVEARKAAAVSVVKYGFPVPAAKITTRFFSR